MSSHHLIRERKANKGLHEEEQIKERHYLTALEDPPTDTKVAPQVS